MNAKKSNIQLRSSVLKIVWIVFAVISVIVWLPKTDSLLTSNYEESAKHIDLNSSWDIEIYGKKYKDISLKEFDFPAVNKGDKIILSRKLPDEIPFRDGVLMMDIKHSAVRVLIDGEITYEYGFDRIDKNKSVGSGVLMIDMPDLYEGKYITIEVNVDENKAFTYFDEINIYQWKYADQIILTQNRFPMFLGGFLLVFGLIALLITVFVVVMSPKYFRLFLISSFSVCMGIWTLCYYDIMTVFTIPLYSVALLEYMSLYLAPIFMLGYMYDLTRRLDSKGWRWSYWIMFTVYAMFATVSIGLHTVDKVHCASTLPVLLVVIVIEMLYLFVVLLLNAKRSSKARIQTKMYLVGVFMLVAGIGYDIGSYSIMRYLGFEFKHVKGISSLVIILFVVDLIYIFFMDLTENMMKEKERELLIQSAYSDELTKLYNRRYCTEYMAEAEKKGLGDVAVVCFDVNNLKSVNDTYGHAKGDILICDAARLIGDTFNDYGVVGRMGGDEFIAIINVKQDIGMQDLIECFSKNICKNNEKTDDFPVSIAVGYATEQEEATENIEKLYQIADNRMYQNKKEMKKLLGR